MSEAKLTTNHDDIRHWAEKRGGEPATVRGTGSDNDPGILRLDFKPKDESLDQISWEEFFEKFDNANLPFCIRIKPQTAKSAASTNLSTDLRQILAIDATDFSSCRGLR